MDNSEFKILIVDDVRLNIILVEKAIAIYHYQVRSASNGEQALKMILEEQPHLVLLDLMMPGVDGFEVIRKIRSGECGNPNVSIVVTSALSSEEDKQKCIDFGVNGYVTKPLVIPQLLDVINQQMERYK
ncbi:MAG: response regulator [Bacteroidaceae bacterium]|nr:response regulator [Bacteroidaceae bacterium]MBO4593366.1 response regulator [Bacteroidaceae bacterium]MBR4782959.1 response regulator [Bacteroidaceae bacterium]